jgi:(p)ppGpp synthase/HD superfamily hydrolase
MRRSHEILGIVVCGEPNRAGASALSDTPKCLECFIEPGAPRRRWRENNIGRESPVRSQAVSRSRTILTDRFDRALLYATHVHGGQVRKGTATPYVAHLLAVSATVLEYGGDEEAIAALLHDSAEDQGGKARLEDVRNRFGDRVARVVAACSDSLADTAKGERKADWQKRKEAYLAA